MVAAAKAPAIAWQEFQVGGRRQVQAEGRGWTAILSTRPSKDGCIHKLTLWIAGRPNLYSEHPTRAAAEEAAAETLAANPPQRAKPAGTPKGKDILLYAKFED